MSDPLRLVIFDVDGTLVDSQGHILAAMAQAFARLDLPTPPRAEILGIVGLSLDEAMAQLVPGTIATVRRQLVDGYKQAFQDMRKSSNIADTAPLYPGTLAMLQRLATDPTLLLGVATGKSTRGLDYVIEGHELSSFFVTRQCADHHPSKPHPSMIEAALSETGVAPENALMIGDTQFDRDMAGSAGVGFLGVSWGYHDLAQHVAPDAMIDSWDALPAALVRFGVAA